MRPTPQADLDDTHIQSIRSDRLTPQVPSSCLAWPHHAPSQTRHEQLHRRMGQTQPSQLFTHYTTTMVGFQLPTHVRGLKHRLRITLRRLLVARCQNRSIMTRALCPETQARGAAGRRMEVGTWLRRRPGHGHDCFMLRFSLCENLGRHAFDCSPDCW